MKRTKNKMSVNSDALGIGTGRELSKQTLPFIFSVQREVVISVETRSCDGF